VSVQPAASAFAVACPLYRRGVFDFPALDVAIGLILLYFVLSLVCTSVNEAIATGIGLRSRYLQLGILNLLSAAPHTTDAGIATARSFYAHPLIQTMIRPGQGPDPSEDPTAVSRWWRKPPYPSYLPSRTFVAAIMDVAREAPAKLETLDEEEAKRVRGRLADLDDDFEKSLAAIPNDALSAALLSLYRNAGRDAELFALDAARWFDDAMERVSGWYKRRIRLILLVIATLLVLFMNADSLASARVLWRDDAMRAAVVKQAQDSAATEESQADVETAVRALDLPMGWEFSFGERATQLPNDLVSWLAKLIGLAVTVAALMLGAPFWFDVLSKITRVRGTGAPPPASDAVRSGDGDQRRAGPAVGTG
jgi:hypothetical protein